MTLIFINNKIKIMKKILIIAVLSLLLTSCFWKNEVNKVVENENSVVEKTVVVEENTATWIIEENTWSWEKIETSTWTIWNNIEKTSTWNIEKITWEKDTKKDNKVIWENKESSVKVNTNKKDPTLTEDENKDIDEVMWLLEDIFNEAENEK